MPRPPEPQLSLFEEPEEPRGELAELAEKLPRRLYLGTSSWTFEGWRGIVYHRDYSKQALTRDSLEEYARHPLFRTVGIDSTHYAPPRAELFARYAKQLPAGFMAVSKAWERLTLRAFPAHARYGPDAGRPNPHFLDARLFEEFVLPAYRGPFREHAGPLVFEFAPMRPQERPEPDEFLGMLDAFLGKLPAGLPYAVEIRNRELLTPDYLELLRRHGVAHVLNQWSFMPPVGVQARIEGILTAPFTVVRLLMRPGTRYEDRLEQMAPFDRIVDPDPRMREEVARFALRATREGREAYVIVNNKAEGSAPLTVQAIAEAVAHAAT